MSNKEKIVFITSLENKDLMDANVDRYADLNPNISVSIYYKKSDTVLSTVVTDAHMIVSPDAAGNMRNTRFGVGRVYWDLFIFFGKSLTILSDSYTKQTKDTNIGEYMFYTKPHQKMSKDDQPAIYHETLAMLKPYYDVFTDILYEERRRIRWKALWKTLRRTFDNKPVKVTLTKDTATLVSKAHANRKASKLTCGDKLSPELVEAMYREFIAKSAYQPGMTGLPSVEEDIRPVERIRREFQKRKAERLAGSDTIDQSILDARYREAWSWVNSQYGAFGSPNSVLVNPSDNYSLLDITRSVNTAGELTVGESCILADVHEVQDKHHIKTKQLIELLEKSIRKQ